MFDHVKFGVSDYAASKAFFLRALEPIGVAVVSEGPPTYGVELSRPEGKTSLCLYHAEEKPAHLHLAFTAENRQQVEAFHRAALEAGGKDNGVPGVRPQAGFNCLRTPLMSYVRPEMPYGGHLAGDFGEGLMISRACIFEAPDTDPRTDRAVIDGRDA